MMYWLYDRPIENTLNWIKEKFGKRPELVEGNTKALKAGYFFGDTTEIFTTRYHVEPAQLPAGTYRNVSGNEATALGFVAASVKTGLPLFLGSYPITPASDILHELSRYKNFGVKTFQAEDEIAGINSAIGAAFSGSLALTTTSGPGLSLKTEAIGLAVMTELPIVIVDVQRGGPSTGLPTKTEQGDLLQSIYGRNGEAPVVVLAAQSPSDCFDMALEASRIATKYMTPVILLTDGYLANGSEPWKVPHANELPYMKVTFRTDKTDFHPFSRNENLARPWVIPGTPEMEHRIGGLEKSHIYGNVSYDPDNHNFMVHMRAQKVKNIENDIPELKVEHEQVGELLVLGWGSTYGAITEAVSRIRNNGMKISHAQLRYLNPLPKNTANVINSFKKILIPEVNLGQLAKLIRSEYLVNPIQFNEIRGLPFKAVEIENKIREILGGNNGK
jgi:2-oxoglutarate ferredoxin oxidoreductase subunit alpha